MIFPYICPSLWSKGKVREGRRQEEGKGKTAREVKEREGRGVVNSDFHLLPKLFYHMTQLSRKPKSCLRIDARKHHLYSTEGEYVGLDCSKSFDLDIWLKT
jgi:hypothetical protein